ncbi:MAG: family 10 glycosylhydrolase [Cyanobacteriota bacterium]|nr:family 10 glycosylhydrolase [Cyanobacteriota bacterium]
MANFIDIPQDHWAKSVIEKLADSNIISGYEDDTFKPDELLTRAEFAALLNKAFPDRSLIREALTFTDVAIDYWANEAIEQAYRKGFLTGYLDSSFKPEKKILRVQILVALANGLGYEPSQLPEKTIEVFEDAEKIPDYGISPAAAALEKSIVVNYPKVESLEPNREATRAEVAAFLSQALLPEGEISLIPEEYIAKAEIEPPSWNGESRGVRLSNSSSDVLFSAAEIEGALNQLTELKINTVYPTVWDGAYTLYESAEMGRVGGGSLHPQLDANEASLAEIVARKEAKNLTVIPGLEKGFQLKANSALAANRPNWLTSRKDGSKIVEGSNNDENKYWLNPFHPQVQQFFLQLLIEVVSNYEVDGIQLNQYFGLPVEFGYDDFTKKLYSEENSGKQPPENASDADWVKWRAGKLTDFMRQVFWVVKEYNPNCIISLSSLPSEEAYNNYLQDWKLWESVGLIEELVLQVSAQNLEDFTAELEKPAVQKALRHIPVSVEIATGVEDESMPISEIEERVKAARDRFFAGLSFSSYEGLLAATATTEGQEKFLAMFPETETETDTDTATAEVSPTEESEPTA